MTARLSSIFFLSGLASLAFETLWFHQAGLAFGNSVWASSLVLSGFMAGMGLGNLLAARWVPRLSRPLRMYGSAELVIAGSGVALVYLLPGLGATLAPWLRPLESTPLLLNATRLLLGFLLLLVPSTAMGTTLPLVTAALAARDPRYGVVLGRLYGWNTVGAVSGVLLCELVLLAVCGVRGTAWAAATLLVVLAAAARWLDANWTPAVAPEARPSPVTVQAPKPADATTAGRDLAGSPGAVGWWLAAACATGLALLALEVVWFRMLLLVVLGDSAAFSVMLALVLAGMGVGSLCASVVLSRWPDPVRLAGPVALGAAVLTVLGYASFPYTVALYQTQQVTSLGALIVMAAPLMLPVALASGLLFPLLGAALRLASGNAAGATGWLTSANTAGAALGSLLGGFVLLPALGSEWAIAVVAAIYAATGLALSTRIATEARRPAYVLAGLTLAVLAGYPVGSMTTLLTTLPVERYSVLRGGAATTVEGIREGVSETVVYLQVPTPVGPMFHTMYTNAVAMADTEYVSRRYMKLFVYWPMAVHPGIRHSLLIAYGVGNSAKAMTDSPGIETIDVVDISKDVLEMNRLVYPQEKDSPLSDPRVRVHIEDGRYFLQSTDQRFDLITSEPPPPRAAGVVNLYTREYFALMRERLTDGGMVAYWLPIHAVSDVSSKAIIRAFCDVFEDCSLWNGIGTQLMLVGSRGAKVAVSLDHFTRQWRQPKVAAEMVRLGFERPEQLGALFIGDAPYLRALTADVRPLVDEFPKDIEAGVSSDRQASQLGASFLDTDAARERFRQSALIGRLWPDAMREATLPYFDIQSRINAHGHEQSNQLSTIHAVLTQTPLTTLPLWLLGSNGDFQRVVEQASPEALAQPALQFHLGVRLLAARQYAAAAGPLGRSESLPALPGRIFSLRLYALCMAGRMSDAQQLVNEHDGPLPKAWPWLKETFGLADPAGSRPVS